MLTHNVLLRNRLSCCFEDIFFLINMLDAKAMSVVSFCIISVSPTISEVYIIRKAQISAFKTLIDLKLRPQLQLKIQN